MPKLYFSDEKYLNTMSDKFKKEAVKNMANRISGMVKSLNRLGYEMKSDEFLQGRREYYAAQILYEIMDILSMLTHQNNDEYDKFTPKYGDLSKEAKKELYLKYQDKGYEH